MDEKMKSVAIDFEKSLKKMKAKLKADRKTCLVISSVRSSMSEKPKDKEKYVLAFKAALTKRSEAERRAVETYIGPALKIDGLNPNKDDKMIAVYAVCRQTVPRTPWKGKWDDKDLCWVGEGEFAGKPKPQDHAPKWWQKSGFLTGDKYLSALSRVNSFNQLAKELWFLVPDNDGKKLKKEIKAMHRELNSWCDRNNKAQLPLPPNRSSFLSSKQTAKYTKAGLIRDL